MFGDHVTSADQRAALGSDDSAVDGAQRDEREIDVDDSTAAREDDVFLVIAHAPGRVVCSDRVCLEPQSIDPVGSISVDWVLSKADAYSSRSRRICAIRQVTRPQYWR